MTTDSIAIVPYRREGDYLVGKTLNKPIQNNGRMNIATSCPEHVELQEIITNEAQPNCLKTLDTSTPPLSHQRNHNFLVRGCQPNDNYTTTDKPVKTRKPLITAIKHPEDQSIQDFYNKHITFFIQLNREPHTTENKFFRQNSGTPTNA